MALPAPTKPLKIRPATQNAALGYNPHQAGCSYQIQQVRPTHINSPSKWKSGESKAWSCADMPEPLFAELHFWKAANANSTTHAVRIKRTKRKPSGFAAGLSDTDSAFRLYLYCSNGSHPG
jgi:hypothetical protein